MKDWPERVPLGNGHEVDSLFLVWIARRLERSLWRWTLEDIVNTAWVEASLLARSYDPSKSKITTYLTNFLPSRIAREYSRAFRMSGCMRRPLGDGVGWETVVDFAEFGDDAKSGHLVPSTVDPEPNDNVEIVDLLVRELNEQNRRVTYGFMSGKTARQISKAEGLSAGAVFERRRSSIKEMRNVADQIGLTSADVWGDA